MPEPLPITLSVLTWKSPITLKRTLTSFAPIKDFFQERLVICQESDPEEVAIAEELGFQAVKLKDNVGIQYGLKACASHAKSDSVLIMENDIPWIVDDSKSDDFYQDCKHFLDMKLPLCRLDLFPDPPRKRYVKFWGDTYPPSHTMIGRIRPREASAIAAEIIGFKAFKHDDSMNDFLEKVSDTFHVTDSSHLFWNNHSIMVNKDFFLNTIIARAESHPIKRQFNGKPELESTLSRPYTRSWWRGQKFKIGMSHPGYFGHVRYDRADGDEKAGGGKLAEVDE